MKKILLLTFLFLINYFSFAQNNHGLKLGVNFATIKTEQDYSIEISPLICPVVSYVFRSNGDHFGYFLECGYSQSGFKELDGYGYKNNIRVHNIDFIPAGIQYAFLSDWSKIRPVLQSSIGLRVSLTAKANYHGSSNNDVLEQFLDIPWSVGGGAAIGKHFTVIGSYGGGFITAIQSDTDWKNRQFQLSVTIF